MVGDRSATGRRLVGDQSPTGRRPVASSRKDIPMRSPTSRRSVGNQSPISRRPVADQSPTSRRPTAKPSCDSSATSAIVLNFGRGEVAERLQCMSDLGLSNNNNYYLYLFGLTNTPATHAFYRHAPICCTGVSPLGQSMNFRLISML